MQNVKNFCLLGHTLQLDGAGMASLHNLKTAINYVPCFIRRITNRRRGLKEPHTIKIVQAVISGRITYGMRYLVN